MTKIYKYIPNTQFFKIFQYMACQIHEYEYSPTINYKGILIKHMLLVIKSDRYINQWSRIKS